MKFKVDTDSYIEAFETLLKQLVETEMTRMNAATFKIDLKWHDGARMTVRAQVPQEHQLPPSEAVFSSAENEAIRGVVEQMIEACPPLAHTVAAQLGVTEEYLAAFLDGTRGARAGFGRKVARARGVTLATMLEWGKPTKEPT